MNKLSLFLAICNFAYVACIGIFLPYLIFNIIFYMGWGALFAGFAYFAGIEKGEKLKLKSEQTDKHEE